MSHQQFGLFASDDAEKGVLLQELRKFDAAREAAPVHTVEFDWPAAAEREQLEREIAAIERASAALCKADPAMESWIDMPTAAMPKPRPVWLLIGALWLSTALVTVGAVFAISALVG